MKYYDSIASGYNELHKEEQLAKLSLIKASGMICNDDKLLDVGCGTGFSLDYFEVNDAMGIDPSLELVKQYVGTKKILVGQAENLPFEEGIFDVVISVTALQNFKHIKQGLEEIRRVGKNRFVLTMLKRSAKLAEVKSLINEVFDGFATREVQEEKDILFFLER